MKKIYILLILFSVGITVGAQSYKVIVNNTNSTSALSKKQVSNLFLKKEKKWPDGSKVAVIDLKGNNPTRKVFSSEVHSKSTNAVKSYWQQAVFSGKGTPPVEKSSDQDVINFVKQNSGAIGYVSSGTNTSGVKTITVSD
ncbi:hypothetical protein E9993_19800 [Labilibacter sediminis]|nr:hypothetical protein E9993_19800 [Labilibacter sediminis]